MSAVPTLNPKAESARQAQALAINISAARSLAEMLTDEFRSQRNNEDVRILLSSVDYSWLVSGAWDIKITKDVHTLLHEMVSTKISFKKNLFDYNASSISNGFTYCECCLSTR